MSEPAVAEEQKPAPFAGVVVPPKKEEPKPVETPQLESSKPVVIMSELDSYISEQIKSQPPTLDEAVKRFEQITAVSGRHRLVLPEFFERMSWDCTWGQECPAHTNGQRGPWVFRWVFKEKRGIDNARNVIGWMLVNRAYFPQAPRLLFTANGGVEIGDAILMFMPVKKALEIREAPGKKSRERIDSQMTPTGQDYTLMTGNPKDERVYQPDLGPEAQEASETSVPGVLVEGRDF